MQQQAPLFLHLIEREVHSLADAVVEGFENIPPCHIGENPLDTRVLRSELEVVVDPLLEEPLPRDLNILELLELKKVVLPLEFVINHAHDPQIV